MDENDKWTKDILVTLTDLEFDDEYHKPYIFDADVVYLKKHPEAFARRKSIENTRQDLINALIERKEKEKQDAIKKEKEISDIRIWLKNNGETVEPYKNKTKYGFKYKNRIILQPKYTSIEQLKEGTYIAGFQRQYRFYNNTFEADSYKSITDKFITIDAKALKMSYYEVAFNRKYGLVRRDGVEVVPIEYRNIFIISDVYDIILAQYKCVDLHIQYSKLRYI